MVTRDSHWSPADITSVTGQVCVCVRERVCVCNMCIYIFTHTHIYIYIWVSGGVCVCSSPSQYLMHDLIIGFDSELHREWISSVRESEPDRWPLTLYICYTLWSKLSVCVSCPLSGAMAPPSGHTPTLRHTECFKLSYDLLQHYF